MVPQAAASAAVPGRRTMVMRYPPLPRERSRRSFSAPRGSLVVSGRRFRMEQGTDGLTAVDPAHGFGQGRRDRQYRELRHLFFGRDGNRVRADYFEYVRLGGEALGGGIGENSVGAGDPYGTGFMVAQMPKQFQNRSAVHDLVVENDDVTVAHIADQHRNSDLRVAQPFLGARRHRHSQSPGEGCGTLGISQVGRHHHPVAEIVASEILRELVERMEVIDRDTEEPVNLRRMERHGEDPIGSRGASRSATRRPPIEMRGASFLSDRA